LSVVLTPGQRHDSTQLGPVLDATRVPRPSGQGRPRKRPDHLVGDKAYSYRGRNVVERCFNRLKQFRAVATPVREAGGQLPGDGGDRLAADLAGRMSIGPDAT
jgi:hypothetical protein